jgi:hypothetical protein
LAVFAAICVCVNTCFTRVYGFRPSFELKQSIALCTIGLMLGAVVVLELFFRLMEEVLVSQQIKSGGWGRLFVIVANLGILMTVLNFAASAAYFNEYGKPGQDAASRAMSWALSSSLPVEDVGPGESTWEWIWKAPWRLVSGVVETTKMLAALLLAIVVLQIVGPALQIVLKTWAAGSRQRSPRGPSGSASLKLLAAAVLLGAGLVFMRRETFTLCFYASGVGVAASVFRTLMEWVEESMEAAHAKQMDTDEWGVPHDGAAARPVTGADALSSLVTGLSPLVPFGTQSGPQRPEPVVATLVSATGHLLGLASGPRPSLKTPSRIVELLADYGVCDAGGAHALLDFMRTAHDVTPSALDVGEPGAVASSSPNWERTYNRSVFSCVAASSERAAARMATIVHATDVYSEGVADFVGGVASGLGLAAKRETGAWQWLDHCSAKSRLLMSTLLDAGEVELLRSCSAVPLQWHARLTYEAVASRADDFASVGFRVDAIVTARGKGKTGPLSAAAMRYMSGADSRRAAEASDQLWFFAEEDDAVKLRLDKAASGGCSTAGALAACRDFKARPWISAAAVPLQAHTAPKTFNGLVYSAGAYRPPGEACAGGHERIFTDAEAGALFPRQSNALELWCLKGQDATRVRPVCRVASAAASTTKR